MEGKPLHLEDGQFTVFDHAPDRVPRDLRVDTPEIQESFRVSFSDAAQRPTVTDEGELGADSRLLAYRHIAAL